VIGLVWEDEAVGARLGSQVRAVDRARAHGVSAVTITGSSDGVGLVTTRGE
jgi:hypothetical protein